MRIVNTETPTYAGSAGSNGEPAVVETMQLVDRDGGEVASFIKGVDGRTAATVVGNAVETLTDGATVTWTFLGNESRNAKVTLGGNRTLAISGATTGASGTLIVIQDGTGSRTLTLPSGSKVVNGGAGVATLTTTAAAIDILSFLYDGTTFYWTVGLDFTGA